MFRTLFIIAALVGVAGCAATLPYTPDKQPAGARVSAAYQMVGDKLRIEIDTDRRRLEEAVIVKADGARVRAQAIEVVPRVTVSSPVSVGVGVGTGTYGRGVGVGTGVSVGVPVGGGETTTNDGNTHAYFTSADAGPPPWQLHVKLNGVEPVVIVVGAARNGRR